MSLCWQQITFCAVALVLVLANVGTAQKRREKPSTCLLYTSPSPRDTR